jgi:hypothetical protein
MATVLFSAAGSAVGGSIGSTALGMGAATIGRATGAVAGSMIDQVILGGGAAAVEVGRARGLRIQSSTEGAPIPIAFGRMRVAGQVIWATRFRENVRTTSQGGKGIGGAVSSAIGGDGARQQVREYSYTVSFAVGLGEGPIERIGRVWADGKLLDLAGINHRLYPGHSEQLPDPKIEAVEGAGRVPAYRGLAYLVFEELEVGQFGNRIPQLNVEVFRAPGAALAGAEAGRPLPDLVRGVCISPGSGEFALDPQAARVVAPAGGGRYININNARGRADMAVALDQLDAELPNCAAALLVVSWFGNDLRAGSCLVEPRVEQRGRATAPEPWSVAGLTSDTARLVSRDAEDRPIYGGTPSDGSVVRAVRELAQRGKKVVLYPFLLMDVAAGNDLPDPYGGARQAAFPWRGRITLDVAPGLPGSADKQAAAAAQVADFFGTASAADFSVSGGKVVYRGPAEWSWRRFVLHMAALGAAAGGVEAICIGSELRGLTTIRSGPDAYPAVQQLIALAVEVRALLPAAKITYAADWSEYFGHQPQDGSGDVLFHLDPLWADANIDMIGIDDYTPLSDWRYTGNHADAEARSVYSLPYLASNVEGGEYYDWYYADDADRVKQRRRPIADGAHGEPWVFRAKDIRNWWANPHHNRLGGVRSAAPTLWVPRSKPVWLTEVGCPAVDLGANKPNLFFDPKSSESALPPSSRGARDDEMQRRFLQAKLGYWDEPGVNPTSPVYGGPMIPEIFVWTWDARPWPDFPVRESVWSDGPAHRLGHWITGRVSSGSLAAIVTEICARSGLGAEDIDVSRLYGTVDGYLFERTGSAREALQPLMQAFGFDAFESGGRIVFATRQGAAGAPLGADRLVAGSDSGDPAVTREAARLTQAPDTVRLSYLQAEVDYRLAAAEARLPAGDLTRISETSLELALPGSRAQQIVDRWLAEAIRAQERAEFRLPLSAMAWEPGDVVSLAGVGQDEEYRIDRITDAGARMVEAVRVEPSLYFPTRAPERSLEPEVAVPPGPISAILMDLPLASGSGGDHQPRLAVTAEPWPGKVAVFASADGEGFDLVAMVRKPALVGLSAGVLPPGAPGRWQRVGWDVLLPSGSISAASRLAVLNGANRLAVLLPSGEWEILQFRNAELTGEDAYRVGHLLRGQRGTDVLSTKPIAPGARIVVLDDAVIPLPMDAAERGLMRTLRIGPAKRDISDPAYVELTGVPGGTGLRPFAPAHLRARRVGGDLAVRWVRTTRIGGGDFAAFEVPLGEAREAYRVTIRQGATVLRRAEVTAPVFDYTAAMQAADRVAGGVTIGVAQLSTSYGYGPERMIDV